MVVMHAQLSSETRYSKIWHWPSRKRAVKALARYDKYQNLTSWFSSHFRFMFRFQANSRTIMFIILLYPNKVNGDNYIEGFFL